MVKKIIVIVLILSVIFTSVSVVNAGILDDIIQQGNKFEDSVDKGEKNLFKVFDTLLKTKIKPAIGLIGNLIFAAVTVILGVKYVWSSAEGRASVAESLPTYVLAVVLFYLAGTIGGFMTGIASSIGEASNWASLSGKIIWIINTVVKYLSLAGIVYMGIRYMLASAEGKANMKTNVGGFIIGLLFTFTATNIITFIVNAAHDVL